MHNVFVVFTVVSTTLNSVYSLVVSGTRSRIAGAAQYAQVGVVLEVPV